MAKKPTPGVLELPCEALLFPVRDVLGAVEKKGTLPVLGAVLIQGTGETVTALGTNLEMEFQASRDCEGARFRLCLPAVRLHEVLDRLPGKAPLLIDQPEPPAGPVTIRQGRGRWVLPAFDPDNMPTFETDKPIKGRFFVPADALKAAMKATQHAMAKADVRYYLNGLCWQVSADGDLVCQASDGHRCAEASAPLTWDAAHDPVAATLILPRNFVPQLIAALPSSDVQVEVTVREASVDVGLPDGYTLKCKLIESRWPDFARVTPREFSAWCDVDRDALEKLVARTELKGETYAPVKIALGEGALCLSAATATEEAEDAIPVHVHEGDAEQGFNGKYLMDALKALGGKSIKLQFSAASGALVVRNPEQPSAWALIMGIRL